jgi:hypothetical protein
MPVGECLPLAWIYDTRHGQACLISLGSLSRPCLSVRKSALRTLRHGRAWCYGFGYQHHAHSPLKIWKTLCKCLEGICNIPMQKTFILSFPDFLFCFERCHWSIIFVSQLQRAEQNRKLGTCNRNWRKFYRLLATLQIPSRDFAREFFKLQR